MSVLLIEEMLADNVQHVQIRTSLPKICTTMKDLGCFPLSKHQVAEQYMKLSSQFEKDHPDFCGTSFIIAQSRRNSPKMVENHLKLAAELVEKYPKYFVGFDLVGQEDLGRPLADFAG